MNSFKKIIKFILNEIGYNLTPIINSDVGNSIPEYTDQKKIIGDKSITIFDVGAHHGQTSSLYNSLFKNATIFSFEPSPDSFEVLKKCFVSNTNITPINCALSNTNGSVAFHINESSQTNSLLETDKRSNKTWDENLLNTKETIQIESITIDDFVKNNGVVYIDILKLDTQGTEYKIIEGAAKTIAEKKVKLIYLEIITMPTYKEQKYFDEIVLLLRKNNFNLYNLYNFSHTLDGELRQLDAIFVQKDYFVNSCISE